MTKGITLFIKSSGLLVNSCYIGKTKRCLIIRINEHVTKDIKLLINVSMTTLQILDLHILLLSIFLSYFSTFMM